MPLCHGYNSITTYHYSYGIYETSSVWQGSKDMLYLEPIIRPLPKPSELIDKTQPKQST